MAERPPATDLSGGKTSEDSLTRLMASLVVEYAVDFQFDLFLFIAFGLTMSFEVFDCLPFPVQVTDRMGS